MVTKKREINTFKVNSSIIAEMGLDYDNQNKSFILLNKDKINKYINLFKVEIVERVEIKEEEHKNNKVERVERVENKLNKDKKSTISTFNHDFSKKNSDLLVKEEKIFILSLKKEYKTTSRK